MIKDLDKLARDPSNIIIVDNQPLGFSKQWPDNGIAIKTWQADDPNDTELRDLIPILEAMADVKDVRPVIKEHLRSF